jgi:subfamily B ATP-binding cassette protein MsbA
MRKKKLDNVVIIKRLWAILKPYRGRAFLSLLAMALTAATQPLLGNALELLMDKGFKEKVPFSLWWIPGVLVSIFVLRGIGTFSTAYYNNWVLSRVLNDLRARPSSACCACPWRASTKSRPARSSTPWSATCARSST